jgi:hypothetical protein
MAHHFSHHVPLGTPSLDYAGVDVPVGSAGVTAKGSVWFPPAAQATEFIARWAQDDWRVVRRIPKAELQRYKDATVAAVVANDGGTAAYAYARTLVAKTAAPATAPAPAPTRFYNYVDPTQPSYFYPPGTQPPVAAPGTQPPAAPGGSITEQSWFWPAVGAGAIGLVALVWAFTPARTVVRKAASRFMGF